jgi:hypothetical protein
MTEASETKPRWSFVHTTYEKDVEELVSNFKYFVHKTLKPNTIRKYQDWHLKVNPVTMLIPQHIAAPRQIRHFGVEAEVRELDFRFEGCATKPRRFKKTLIKFIEYMNEFLACMLGEDKYGEVIEPYSMIARKVPLTDIYTSDGFIMEGKTQDNKRFSNSLFEPTKVTLALTMDGSTILEKYPQIIPAIYFFNLCSLAFNDERIINLDRSAISLICFRVLYGGSESDDIYHFFNYFYAFLGCTSIHYKLYKRLSPENLEVPNRSFEKKFYGTEIELAKYRLVYHKLFDNVVARVLKLEGHNAMFMNLQTDSFAKAKRSLDQDHDEQDPDDETPTKKAKVIVAGPQMDVHSKNLLDLANSLAVDSVESIAALVNPKFEEEATIIKPQSQSEENANVRMKQQQQRDEYAVQSGRQAEVKKEKFDNDMPDA